MKKASSTNAFLIFLLGAAGLSAQVTTINANIRGGGNGSEGKCTIEVEVDQTAEIEIVGTQARMRTLGGSPATFRRMDCDSAMPRNPANFRFQGVDGRGSQTLTQNPSQSRNGAAVVRIDDSKGGREGYTFDIFWSGGSDSGFNNGGFGNNGGPGRDRDNGGFGRGNGNGNGGGGWNSNGNNGNWNNSGRGRWGTGWNDSNASTAMRNCQSEVANRIRRQGFSDIQFGRVDFDNNRNRPDLIQGTLRAVKTFGSENYSFACQVDFSSGRVGNVKIDRR